MEENAKVCWIPHEEPWVLEETLIATVSLPLNIQGNKHPFKTVLSAMRSRAMAEAKLMEIADETGFSRSKVAKAVQQVL
ncbi:hypothetical protein K6W81_05465 [Enterobacter sp. MW07]|nr:hypothetical protein [Enterobacter sp. MW07]